MNKCKDSISEWTLSCIGRSFFELWCHTCRLYSRCSLTFDGIYVTSAQCDRSHSDSDMSGESLIVDLFTVSHPSVTVYKDVSLWCQADEDIKRLLFQLILPWIENPFAMRRVCKMWKGQLEDEMFWKRFSVKKCRSLEMITREKVQWSKLAERM